MRDLDSETHLSREFRGAFPDSPPDEWEVTHVTFENFLTDSGAVKRSVHLALEPKVDAPELFEWRIPLPFPTQTKVYGFGVFQVGGLPLDAKLSYHVEQHSTKPDYAIAEICMPKAKIGERVAIILEYLINNYSSRLGRWGLFKRRWEYKWTYLVYSETCNFRHVVVLPPNSMLRASGVRSNLCSPFFSYRYKGDLITVWVEEKPRVGEIWGQVVYYQETPYAATLFGLISGTVLTGALSVFLGFAGKLSAIGAAAAFSMTLVGVAVMIFLAKRTLPSFR
jgi:hypothetical protein